MCDSAKTKSNYVSPQCHHFVLRKKRLCRMTVKPGKQYCGEHEPQPKTDDGQDDTRIPCPNDPKHTCYVSKLDKHLSICNARQVEQPDYIIPNINAPTFGEEKPRLSLSEIPVGNILKVIEKINILFETNLKDKIETLPERPIHSAVLQEFNEPGRTESSLKHLRQVSSLLHIVEAEGLVEPETCYLELGAGKGQLSWFAWRAWGGRRARVLLVDRAAPRHKRDGRLRGRAGHGRVRADLAHLALARVPAARAAALVAHAKHLCGDATDYALRCVTARGVRLRGLVLAPCCHHRCRRAPYAAARRLPELGIDEDDFNIMLGLVSWATSGDGRSRQRRAASAGTQPGGGCTETQRSQPDMEHKESQGTQPDREITVSRGTQPDRESAEPQGIQPDRDSSEPRGTHSGTDRTEAAGTCPESNHRELQAHHIEADPHSDVITSHKTANLELIKGLGEEDICTDGVKSDKNDKLKSETSSVEIEKDNIEIKEISAITVNCTELNQNSDNSCSNDNPKKDCIQDSSDHEAGTIDGIKGEPARDLGTKNLNLSKEHREEVGRRAKALLDWGRVLYMQECGFDARLVYYVPSSVSLENVCIVATKKSDAVLE